MSSKKYRKSIRKRIEQDLSFKAIKKYFQDEADKEKASQVNKCIENGMQKFFATGIADMRFFGYSYQNALLWYYGTDHSHMRVVIPAKGKAKLSNIQVKLERPF